MCMEGTADYIHLLLAGEFDKVDSIAGYANSQLRIQFRMFHRIYQHIAV